MRQRPLDGELARRSSAGIRAAGAPIAERGTAVDREVVEPQPPREAVKTIGREHAHLDPVDRAAVVLERVVLEQHRALAVARTADSDRRPGPGRTWDPRHPSSSRPTGAPEVDGGGSGARPATTSRPARSRTQAPISQPSRAGLEEDRHDGSAAGSRVSESGEKDSAGTRRPRAATRSARSRSKATVSALSACSLSGPIATTARVDARSRSRRAAAPRLGCRTPRSARLEPLRPSWRGRPGNEQDRRTQRRATSPG